MHFLKQSFQLILAKLAKGIIAKQKPMVIAITGSVGKTSTKEAVSVLLADQFNVRKTAGNFNNEFGLPFTIIGVDSPGKNPLAWLRVFAKGAWLNVVRGMHYPQVLVLEMGADKPGDISYLTSIAKPDIAVVTTIGDEPVHVEFFKNPEHLAKEKFSIFKRLTKTDWAIINLDDGFSRKLQHTIKTKLLTVAVEQEADIQAVEIEYSHNPTELAESPHVAGLRFKLRFEGSTVPVFLPGVVGMPSVYAVLFAAAVAKIAGINLVELGSALQQYVPAKGRMNLLPGQANSLIIDDTYNSSPGAVQEALAVLEKMETPARKIACLGYMAELGEYSESAHTAVGKHIAEQQICDELIVVGDETGVIADVAIAHGMPEEFVYRFTSSVEAGNFMQKHIQHNDVVLVKGSQSSRMEKVVKAIMAEPERASELLVRQYGSWLNS